MIIIAMILYRNIFTRIHFFEISCFFPNRSGGRGDVWDIYLYALTSPARFSATPGVGSSRRWLGLTSKKAQAPGDYSPQAPGPDIDYRLNCERNKINNLLRSFSHLQNISIYLVAHCETSTTEGQYPYLPASFALLSLAPKEITSSLTPALPCTADGLARSSPHGSIL